MQKLSISVLGAFQVRLGERLNYHRVVLADRDVNLDSSGPPADGVRRAALMFRAAIARCTTRKLVHQYPNDSTKPRPNTMANQSTPMGLAAGLPMLAHE